MQNTSGKYLDLHSAYFSQVNHLNICVNSSFAWSQLKNYLQRTKPQIYYSLPCNQRQCQAPDLLTNLQENKPRHTNVHPNIPVHAAVEGTHCTFLQNREVSTRHFPEQWHVNTELQKHSAASDQARQQDKRCTTK